MPRPVVPIAAPPRALSPSRSASRDTARRCARGRETRCGRRRRPASRACRVRRRGRAASRRCRAPMSSFVDRPSRRTARCGAPVSCRRPRSSDRRCRRRRTARSRRSRAPAVDDAAFPLVAPLDPTKCRRRSALAPRPPRSACPHESALTTRKGEFPEGALATWCLFPSRRGSRGRSSIRPAAPGRPRTRSSRTR